MSMQNYEHRLQQLAKIKNANIVFKRATEYHLHIIVDDKKERVLCKYCNYGDNLEHTGSSSKRHTHWKQLCDDPNCPKVFFATVSANITKKAKDSHVCGPKKASTPKKANLPKRTRDTVKIPPKICKRPKNSKRGKSFLQIPKEWWVDLDIRHLDAPLVTTKKGLVDVAGVTCKPDHELGGFGLCGTGTVYLKYKTGQCTTRVPVVVFWKGAQMSNAGHQTLPSLYKESKFYSEYCKDLQPCVPVTLGYFAIPARFANQLDIDSRACVGIVMTQYTPVNTLLTKTAMDSSATRRLLVSFLTACGRVHGKGVLHCDLKTSNLAVERGLDPCIRILDWGSWAEILEKRNAHRMGTPFWRKYEWFGDGKSKCVLPADEYFHIGMVVLHFFAGRRHKLGRRELDRRLAQDLGHEFQKQKDTNWCRFLVSHTAIQTTVGHPGLQQFQLALSKRLGGCDALVEAVGVLWNREPQSTQGTSHGTALLKLAVTLNKDCLWRNFGTSPLDTL